MPITVLHAGDIAINKTDQTLLLRTYILMKSQIMNKQTFPVRDEVRAMENIMLRK